MKLSQSIVCTHVLTGARPILRVWRDESDTILACGRGDHAPDSIDDWAPAHTFHFTANDPALGVVHQLTQGEEAERARVGAPWRRRLTPDAERGRGGALR